MPRVSTKGTITYDLVNSDNIYIYILEEVTPGNFITKGKINLKNLLSAPGLEAAGVSSWQTLLKLAIASDSLKDLTNGNTESQTNENGVYKTGASTTNLPAGTNNIGILEVYNDGNLKYQRYFTYYNSKIEVWLRYYNGSAWTSWVRSDQDAKDYADSLVVGLWDDRGNYDASGNVFPSSGGSGDAGAILKGDIWTITVAGTLGGEAVEPGDTVRALSDAPGQTASNWAIAAVASTNFPNGLTVDNTSNFDFASGLKFGSAETTGLHLASANELITTVNAVRTHSQFSTHHIFGPGDGYAGTRISIASATIPVILPVSSDTNTGIGSNGPDELSHIAGGVEGIRVTPTAVNCNHPLTVSGQIQFNTDIISLTTSTTLDSTHKNKIVECSNTITVTLPNGMPKGYKVDIVNVGTGTITIAATGTLQSDGTLLVTQYTGASAYHRGSNIWIVVGKLTSP